MKCQECGADVAEGDRHCTACGALIQRDDATDPEGSASSSEPDDSATDKDDGCSSDKPSSSSEKTSQAHGFEQNPKDPAAPVGVEHADIASGPAAVPAKAHSSIAAALFAIFKGASPDARRKRVAIIAGAIAVICILIGVVVFTSIANSNVPEEVVKKDFEKSSFVKKGSVLSTYCEESPYKIKEFKLDGQEDVADTGGIDTALLHSATGNAKLRNVHISGKIANESFETTFTGHVCYSKDGNGWKLSGDPITDTHTSIPLKGVSKMEDTSSNQFHLGSSVKPEFSDVSSTLDENDGSYTSTATVKVKYSFWFADDTAVNKQKFTFDEDGGWTPQGDVKVSDTKTEWKLSGKTFEYSKSGFGRDLTMSLALKDSDGGNLSAAYTIVQKASSASSAYKDLNLSGTATGKPAHKYGEDNFTLPLNDPDQQVSFKVGRGYPQTVAGFGEVNTLDVSYDTKAAYMSFFGSESHLEGHSTFTEKTAESKAD
ncbi:hypothetical protein Corgl_0931 [Coriobacterium glomerans PW2]|uniref:Zinc-ribbon domain-containing protein n=1 Tax=Coriobacterium glomerans (strain ATCC 49209 / DSM 20642 / JCM 10262 / PW2) TaxID=700015 RepID=F2N9L2_CORGP|nr:zinc ribbon domain-containing protein [Coriobacterium glomerans]AEB07041.1 hypothetical protein Corgl_0931 [Coriobacterium glomerans PW2]